MALPPPPAGQVRMTLVATGGEAYAPIEVYRSIWWPKGWRSIDDPSFVGTPEDDPERYTTVAHGWGTHWQTARHEAGNRIVRVQVWGDSIAAGQSAADQINDGWVGLLRDDLQARYGNGGSGYIPWSLAAGTGTWASGIGFGGGMGTASGAATRTWSNMRGTEIRIFHKTLGVTGSFRWRIDGGSFTTVTTPTGVVEPGCVVVTGLGDTTHTVEVERVSGSVSLHGVEARRPNGVITQLCAQGGRAASDFATVPIGRVTVGTTGSSTTITSAAPGAFTSTMVGRFIKNAHINDDTTIASVASATSATLSVAAATTGTADAVLSLNSASRPGLPGFTIQPAFDLVDGLEVPDVIILCIGANDPGVVDYNAQTVAEGLAAILRSCTTSATLTHTPDLVVMVEHFGTWVDVGQLWPELVDILAGVAAGHGGALIDIWGLGRRSWKYWDDLDYFADSIHPSEAGHAAYAAPVIDLLRS